jgi:hypothetical protein
MAYWIEVRWPPIPTDRLSLLYFSQGRSLARSRKMAIGDHVLYYETLDPRPGTNVSGSGTIFAHAQVTGDLAPRPPEEVATFGKYIFTHTRQMSVLRRVPPEHGVPLFIVQKVVGNRPMYGMEVPRGQFGVLLRLLVALATYPPEPK